MCVCVCVCVCAHRQTVSLYHNTSVRLDHRNGSRKDRNPADFQSIGYLPHKLSSFSVTHRNSLGVYSHIRYRRLSEYSIHEKSFIFTRMWQPAIPQSCAQFQCCCTAKNKYLQNYLREKYNHLQHQHFQIPG